MNILDILGYAIVIIVALAIGIGAFVTFIQYTYNLLLEWHEERVKKGSNCDPLDWIDAMEKSQH